MSTSKMSLAGDLRYHKFQLKVETEELALLVAIRDAEAQLRSLNREGVGPETESEREAWAIKSNYYRQRLRVVRQSLDRLQAGEFGICASCNEEIGVKRLNAVPSAIYCLECQEQLERQHSRDLRM
jgi:RNA polymerase-binding transcription factor DksA